MKIVKYVEIESHQEVVIHISGEDAVEAIFESVSDTTPDRLLGRLFNDVTAILININDERIAALHPKVRSLIRSFCVEQAERFK